MSLVLVQSHILNHCSLELRLYYYFHTDTHCYCWIGGTPDHEWRQSQSRAWEFVDNLDLHLYSNFGRAKDREIGLMSLRNLLLYEV